MLLRFDVYKGFSKDVNCFPKPNYWLLQSKFIEKTLPFTVEPVVMTYRQFAIVSIVLKQNFMVDMHASKALCNISLTNLV